MIYWSNSKGSINSDSKFMLPLNPAPLFFHGAQSFKVLLSILVPNRSTALQYVGLLMCMNFRTCLTGTQTKVICILENWAHSSHSLGGTLILHLCWLTSICCHIKMTNPQIMALPEMVVKTFYFYAAEHTAVYLNHFRLKAHAC